ncbi:MAG: GNAT family N-acetyltransferase [Chloroflexota bacterium]
MVWPTSPQTLRRLMLPAVAAGYAIHPFCGGDEPAFLALMNEMDFGPWDEAKLTYNLNKAIPDGWFLAVDSRDQMVATAMGLHNYKGNAPFTADLGWVACHPAHQGQGLATALVVRVVQRLLAAGYTRIQLHTEYYRLPALNIYFKLGFVPLLNTAVVIPVWQDVCARLGRPYTPALWASAIRQADDCDTGQDQSR